MLDAIRPAIPAMLATLSRKGRENSGELPSSRRGGCGIPQPGTSRKKLICNFLAAAGQEGDMLLQLNSSMRPASPLQLGAYLRRAF